MVRWRVRRYQPRARDGGARLTGVSRGAGSGCVGLAIVGALVSECGRSSGGSSRRQARSMRPAASAVELWGLRACARACPVGVVRVPGRWCHGRRPGGGEGTRRAYRGVVQVQRSVGVALSLSEHLGRVKRFRRQSMSECLLPRVGGEVGYARILLRAGYACERRKAPGGPVQRPIHARVRNGQE